MEEEWRIGTWTWRRRSRAAKSWMSKIKKLLKELREIEKFSLFVERGFRKASRVTCSSNCKRWSKGGMASCQSTRKCRKDHKTYKAFEICKKWKVLQHKRRYAEDQSGI